MIPSNVAATVTPEEPAVQTAQETANETANSELISDSEEEPEMLAAPSAPIDIVRTTNGAETSSSAEALNTITDPRIVWTEDLDDDDTLAVSDDDSIAAPPTRSTNVVVEIEDDAPPSPDGPSVGDKRHRSETTIDISSDDEDMADGASSSKRNKSGAVANGDDEEATLADVLATFDDEINGDFIEL